MRRLRGDDGVYAILYALLMLVVLGMASIVVDLGLLRADKRDSRSAADSAALAGAADLGAGPYAPFQACETAWEFALDNLRLPPATSPCAGLWTGPLTLVQACTGIAETATGTVEGVTVSITWPVPSVSDLLTDPDGEPASGTPRTYDEGFDGTAAGCDRLGVAIQRERTLGTATALGVGSGGSYAGSVARTVFKPSDSPLPYPLVVLDEHSCDALAVSGGTTVLVKNSGDTPGRIGVDSDGTSTGTETNSDACSGGDVVIDAAGTGSRTEAQDGASGAPAAIEVYGPSTLPARAYDSADLDCASSCLKPTPTVRSVRVTRAPFDKVYNCGPDRPDPPRACAGGSAEKAYVDRFAAAATALSGTPVGWTTLSGAACDTAPPTTSTHYFVDCPLYRVTGEWAFPPGATVVINGDLRVDACLVMNATAAACTSPPATGPPYLATNGLLSVRGRVYSSGSVGKLVLPQTFLHQPLTSSRFEGSGFELMYWTAPYVPAADLSTLCPAGQAVSSIPPVACFRNLAFWTEAPSPNNSPAIITGGGLLQLEGTFFLGNAKLRLAGGSLIDVNNAQFVAKRIEASGGSLLTFIPNPDRTTEVPALGVALVR